jgi:acyl dehydratase
VLHVESEVIENRISASRPAYGWVKMRNMTKNQRGEVVQEMVANLTVPRRSVPSAAAGPTRP